MGSGDTASLIDLSGQNILFISDVHLGGFDKARNTSIENDLLSVLNQADSMGWRIVVLGDLSDYFMEYDGWVPECGEAVFSWFRDYHKRGNLPTLMVTGNHDNWSTVFYQECGFLLTHEYFKIKLDDRTGLILHGDGLLDPSLKLPRPTFHRLLRNTYFVSMFKRLTSPSYGNMIMRWFSRYSRRRKGEIDPDFGRLDVWATECLRAGITDFIIAGHDHNPRFSNISGRFYVNTGAFFHDRTCALYNTNEGLRLVSWDSNSTTFITIHTETGPTRP